MELFEKLFGELLLFVYHCCNSRLSYALAMKMLVGYSRSQKRSLLCSREVVACQCLTDMDTTSHTDI